MKVRVWIGTIVVLFALLGHIYAVERLSRASRLQPRDEISVYLPPVAQLVSAAGDRYLAANFAVFRTFMAGTGKLGTGEYEILAWLHADAALFNPGHEDNYYVAAAILPWAGHVKEAQYVLSRAIGARPHDYLPPLLFGFHQWHFEKDGVAAAETLRAAASRMPDETNRLAFESLAAAWYERAEGSSASAVLRLMAAQTRNVDFATYLRRRADRLEAISTLESAVTAWRKDRNDLPTSVADLVAAGYVSRAPIDPFGGGFGLSPEGEILVVERK